MATGLDWLFDTTGFRPRKECGDWSPELVGLNAGSDVLIWLAYVSIPLVLGYFARHRGLGPYKRLFWLFAAFILACGTTHLLDALAFEYPLYRLAGVVKFVTAVVSWATIAALVPAVPGVLLALTRAGAGPAPPTPGKPDAPESAVSRAQPYIVAVLAALAAVLVRVLFDPLLAGDRALVIPLMAVVFVAWHGGFKPALLTLVLSMAAVVYLFIPPRHSWVVAALPDQFAIGFFLFAGLLCAMLGEAQRSSRERAGRHAADLRANQRELEELTEKLAAAQQQTAQTLAQLETFVLNAPLGLAFLDPDLRFVRVNKYLADAHGRPIEEHLGRTPTEALPDFPAEAVADCKRVLASGEPVTDRLLARGPVEAGGEVWQSSYYPVRHPDGALIGVGLVAREVGGRLRAEGRLRETTRRLTSILESIPDAAFGLDPQWRYTYVNPQWEELLGRRAADVVGRVIWEAVPELAGTPVEDGYREAMRSRRAATFEAFNTAAGKWVEFRAYPTPDGGLGVYLRDISSRKRTEDALRESEERYRFLAEALPALVWSAGSDGRPDYRNTRWAEYTGLPCDPADAPAWDEVVHPDDRARTAERWERALAGGTKYQNEYRLRRADGAYRWFLVQALPMRGPDGRVVRWFGTGTDIDDQKRLQLELRHSLDQFRALTEAIPQLVWTTDAAGQVTFFNRRWLDYTGLTVDGWRDKGWRQVLHPADAERMAERWAAAVREGADWFAMEYRLKRASDGEYRWHLSYAVPLRDAEGNTVQWVGALTDIDSQRRQAEILERLVADRTAALTAANAALQQEVEDRRKAEELVRATAAELARSNEELEKFAYIASHDLQEPLRKIQAFGDRLRTKSADRLDPQGRDYLDRVLGSAARMRGLIEDLLAFSRVTTKGQPFARVDLNVIAAGVLSDLETRVAETGGAVDVGPLPAVDADATQMRQLLQNLVGNALKFHRPDVPPRVTVRAEVVPDADGREVCRLSVSDNGIGFDEKYLGRIFQVFQRLHGRHEYEGSGVGLAICRKIVERHGGEITAQSAPGVGTTFVVTLPTRQSG